MAPFYSKEGKEKKELSLNEKIFGVPVNQRLLSLVERGYAANLRSGCASTKNRGEVRGGGRKPWRQKGTGRARHGSIRSPIWRGGGTVFGPRPRDYFVSLPERMKKEALISALSLRAKEKNVVILEEAGVGSPKTAEVVKILKTLPLDQRRTLFVLKHMDPLLKRAARNLSRVLGMQLASDVNAHHILHWPKLLIEEEALAVLESRLLDEAWSKQAEESREKAEVSPS